MGEAADFVPPLVGYGVSKLPAVEITSYNIETRDDEGFIGDRANNGAFRQILDNWREKIKGEGEDPFGDVATEDIAKKKLEEVLSKGDPEAAGLIQGAIEDYAKQLTAVTRRFLKLKAWRDTERLVIGGGFRAGRIGELAIGRTAVLLKAADIDIEVVPIRHDPNEAGLLGAIHLAPSWIFKSHDAILAIDIGGTNIRAGVVELNQKRAKDLSKAAVWKTELWRHSDEKTTREGAVKHIVEILEGLIARSQKEKLKLAPFIGIGCPGIIESDGTIDRGAQNLPGNWESSKFNLPTALREAIPKISKEDTHIVMHNDAVVQGLSEVPFMQDIERWGIFTIGTGLGNASYLNRED